MSAARSSGAACWCGNASLAVFSDEYDLCDRCETLVAKRSMPPDVAAVRDEQRDLYGLNYFVEHARELGHPDLFERSTRDLSERCVYWLKALLRHRPPPARTLELGCANGTFVATLASAGYEATGLDLSPALTEYVRATFGVPVLTGPLEDQALPRASVDVLVLMDVLEHLPDPLATLAAAAPALTDDAVLLIQTPHFDPALSYSDLRARGHPFLEQLKPREHLFLLSEASVRALLGRAGLGHVLFEPAIFHQYDMFLLASRAPIPACSDWRTSLRRSRTARMVEALIDAFDEAQAHRAKLEVERQEAARLRGVIEEIERDRAARLEFIREQAVQLERLHRVEAAHERLMRRLGPLERLFRPRRGPGATGSDE